MQGYLHMTNEANLPGIRREGLIAGKSKGIGQPITGDRSEDVYVVNESSNYKGDVRPGVVGVLSAVPPQPDNNYPPGRVKGGHPTEYGAGHFGSQVRPLREAMLGGQGQGGKDAYSFTFPMSPDTARGAGRLFQAIEGGAPAVPSKAASDRLHARFPMYFPSNQEHQTAAATPLQPAASSSGGRSTAPLSGGPGAFNALPAAAASTATGKPHPGILPPVASGSTTRLAVPSTFADLNAPSVRVSQWPPVIIDDHFSAPARGANPVAPNGPATLGGARATSSAIDIKRK
ncbi:hypothetical protein [Chitinolyticbacter albus]|uniref:hypothetical protein n=1 Tax=Chitinolyticbacter albus TaxID=2961951 RepID=UPI00210ED5E3|nr:hypothetical protein [Chitinolyticbacter albus]